MNILDVGSFSETDKSSGSMDMNELLELLDTFVNESRGSITIGSVENGDFTAFGFSTSWFETQLSFIT